MLEMERTPGVPRAEALNALPFVQRAIARGARVAETFRVWGMIETFNANYPKAIERYRNALELCPGDAETLRRLASILTLRGMKEEALRAASEAAQWDPLDPEALTVRGLVLQLYGDFKEAEQSYARAKQVARGRAEQAADLHTDCLVYLQRAGDALLAATDIAARRREDPISHYRLGRVSQIAGQPIQEWQNVFKQTLVLIDQRLRTSPEDPAMLTLQALTCTRLGQFKDALEADARALRAAPNNLDVLYGTARMYALQRDQKQAAAFLTQAVDERYDLGRIVDMDFFNVRADPDFLRAISR
jgi:tetratricopeptide (TPR) repeat protein